MTARPSCQRDKMTSARVSWIASSKKIIEGVPLVSMVVRQAAFGVTRWPNGKIAKLETARPGFEAGSSTN